MKWIERGSNRLFSYVHGNNLVYNTCWEDPRCDRELLELDADSTVVMITSAGCNALDYLLDGPAQVHCVDMNYRQNAVLELKRALFTHGNVQLLHNFFLHGATPTAKQEYRRHLRPLLPAFAQRYWDENISFFADEGLRRSFYHFGTSGFFAWAFKRYVQTRKGLAKKVDQLFAATSLEEQTNWYHQIEPHLLNQYSKWFLNRHATMCLLGVPREQQRLFKTKFADGATGFIRQCLRHVFTELPITDNYFYRVYWYGEYSKDCCPEYLRAEHFDTLRERVPVLYTHTTTVTDFLRAHPGEYSHYVLLDHQDWLAANNEELLTEEWEAILKNSRPGTKILMRSAAEQVDFLPAFAKARLEFATEKTDRLHQLDRVGTYGSVVLATVKA